MLFLRRMVDSFLNWRMVSALQGIIIICPFSGVEYFSLLVNCIRASGLTTRVTLIVARGHFFCNLSRRLYRISYGLCCIVLPFLYLGLYRVFFITKAVLWRQDSCVILLGRPRAISAHNWTLIHLVTLEYLMFRRALVKSPMWINTCKKANLLGISISQGLSTWVMRTSSMIVRSFLCNENLLGVTKTILGLSRL